MITVGGEVSGLSRVTTSSTIYIYIYTAQSKTFLHVVTRHCLRFSTAFVRPAAIAATLLCPLTFTRFQTVKPRRIEGKLKFATYHTTISAETTVQKNSRNVVGML